MRFRRASPEFFEASKAIEYGEFERFQSLCKEGMFMKVQDGNYVTLLELAAAKNRVRMIKWMLKTRVPARKMGASRYAIQRAISENHPKAVKTIMHHIGPYGQGELGLDSLSMAGHLGRVEIVQVLLDSGIWLEVKYKNYGYSTSAIKYENFFAEMASYGQTAVAKVVIENFREIHGLKRIVRSMLGPAIMSGQLGTVKMLMDYKIGLQSSIFSTCRSSGRVEILDYFVKEHSVNPITDGCLLQPVHKGRLDMVIYLTGLGADVNYRSTDPESLMSAVKAENVEMAKLLLGYGPDINCTTHFGELTPLLVATEHESYETIQLLLLEGADIIKFYTYWGYESVKAYRISKHMMP